MKRAACWVGGGCAVVAGYCLVMPWLAGWETGRMARSSAGPVIPGVVYDPADWMVRRVDIYYRYVRWVYRETSGFDLDLWREQEGEGA